jgi:hypothetical protein
MLVVQELNERWGENEAKIHQTVGQLDAMMIPFEASSQGPQLSEFLRRT